MTTIEKLSTGLSPHYSLFTLFIVFRTITPLQIGNNDFEQMNRRIKLMVTPVRTMMNGLCYKFKVPNSFPRWNGILQLIVGSSTSSGVDKLEKLYFYIASDNTWQGVIMNNWPYSKLPLFVTGFFSTETISSIRVELDENVWKYREGISDFDECMNHQPKQCISILDPSPNR